jgi:hypothetical protein
MTSRLVIVLGAATELYVKRKMVLTEHIVYKTLSTSLTLFPASFFPKGELDAVASEVSDGREGELHL